MKLLNHTLKYLSMALLFVIGLWALLFYLQMIDEVEDSLDDGLENTKMVVIQRMARDPGIASRSGFSEHSYYIQKISERSALDFHDYYQDTLMYTLNEKTLEPFRMLKTVFREKDEYYQLKVVASAVEQDDLLRNLLYSIVLLYIVILVSVFMINNLLLKKIWAPFYVLLKRLKGFRLEDQRPIELPTTNVTEFRELSTGVSELVTQSINSYSGQKQFIENAAHELHTPLAISLSRLEMLSEEEGLSDRHSELIGQVISDLKRMGRLNNSLLLLTRIESRQYVERENVAVGELIDKLVYDFSDFSELKHISVSVAKKEELVLLMSPDLAVVLFSNLIKNALVHNKDEGQLHIEITNGTVVVSNSAESGEMDSNKIFGRFEKGGAEKSGTGLGLTIAKSITELYGLNLSYHYDGMHHFKVSSN
jgi:signal transduction histidine kinase